MHAFTTALRDAHIFDARMGRFVVPLPRFVANTKTRLAQQHAISVRIAIIAPMPAQALIIHSNAAVLHGLAIPGGVLSAVLAQQHSLSLLGRVIHPPPSTMSVQETVVAELVPALATRPCHHLIPTVAAQ